MSVKDLTVLVLGVGGNVSQGILKALALSSLRCRVIGACISPLGLGLYTVDQAYISPRADDPNFLDWLVDICLSEGVQAVLSGVEPVLAVLASQAEEIRRLTGAICIVSPVPQLTIGNDKLATCQWLSKNGFNFPRYAESGNEQALEEIVEDCGYPLIAKSRKGKGAHGLIEINNSQDLTFVSGKDDFIVQEYLGDPTSEYTAGCFCDRNDRVRGTIVMHRELLQGTTYRAEAGEFPQVREEAARIAKALKPKGPCNIQLRMSQGRPVCFEINIRFSGTTPLRARLGFNEVEAALRHYVLGEPARDLPRITKGMALRYWNEIYVDPEAYAILQESGRLDSPQLYDLLVEDYGIRQ
jgi:carbamoyl-phosphate synthase large subunit